MPLAVDTYKKGYAAARKTDHGIGASRHLSNIGRVYYEMDAIDSAVLYYKKAYDEFKSFGDSTAVSATAAFLALCFAAGGDGGQAREWLGIAASYAERKDGRYYLSVMRGLVDCLLASTGGGENSIDAAAAYYKKKKEYRMLSTIYIMKADYALSKGGYAAATAYLNEALSVIELSQEKYKRSRILLRFAAVKFNTGDKGAGKHYYERAVDCAPTGVKLQPLEVIGQKAAGGDERE
jgi:tetratricopeptide (TPR) repeat protein